MQHYGILTRLLDFTSDEYVGLYFAVSKNLPSNSNKVVKEIEDFNENDGWSEEGAAVYCLNPLQMNNGTFQTSEIVNLSKYKFDSLGNIDLPIAIETSNSNIRIKAQKAVFIYFSYIVKSLEEYFPLEKILYKIFIPNSCRKEIYKQLKEEKGITHSVIFPDMDGIAKEINEEMIEHFMNQRKMILD